MTLMFQQNGIKRGVFLIAILAFGLMLPLSFCSRQVAFEKLCKKDGRYFRGADSRPFSGKAVKRYENGGLHKEYDIVDGKIHGRVIVCYRDGNKEMELPYRRGLQHGEAEAWYPRGGKRFVYRYQNGKRDGKSISWDENGQMRSAADFRDGKLNGKWTLWHANGKKQEETEYKSDSRHGTSTQWYANGQMKTRAVLDQGEYHGAVQSWFEDGKKESAKFFSHGRPDGQWQWWYANGKQEMRLGFKDGEYDGAAIGWYENGNKKFARYASHGRPDGTWERWHANGRPRTCGRWQNGKLDGKWLEWESDGGKLEEITFHEGKKIEIFQWYGSGRKKLTASRQDESRSWNWRFWNPDGRENLEKGRPFFKGLYPEFFIGREPRSTALSAGQRRTLASLKKIHDYPVYTMDDQGEYGLNRFLAAGGSGVSSGWEDFAGRQKENFCTTISALAPNGHVLFAHNWDAAPMPILVLFTRPADGYPSISLVDILRMKDVSNHLALLRYKDKDTYLRAPYYPLEGMNDRGLAVACMYAPEKMAGDPRLATVNMSQIIRLVLDYAADLDEAVALFRNYNIRETQHFLVADVSGRSAVIEYKEGELAVIRSREPWQVATNTLMAGVSEESLRRQCWRYDTAQGLLKQTNGRVSRQQVMDILKAVSMSVTPETIASIVYDLNSGELRLAVGRDFKQLLSFRLKMQAATGK